MIEGRDIKLFLGLLVFLILAIGSAGQETETYPVPRPQYDSDNSIDNNGQSFNSLENKINEYDQLLGQINADVSEAYAERYLQLEQELEAVNRAIQNEREAHRITAYQAEQLKKSHGNLVVKYSELLYRNQELRDLVSRLQQENSHLSDRNNALNKSLKTRYYISGSKSSLKSKDLTKKRTDYNKSDFYEIDLSKTVIRTGSKKIQKIIPSRPKYSYSIRGGTLYIKNPEVFWNTSYFLVIQTKK
ncbi:MAG: hypothetical protein AAFX87_15050 [Bacteroidota bacterium]